MDGGKTEQSDNGNDPNYAVTVDVPDTTEQAVEAIVNATGSPQRRWVSSSSSAAMDVVAQSVSSFLGLTDPFLEDDPWKRDSDTSPVTTNSYEVVTDRSSQNSSPARVIKEDPDWPK